MEDKAIEVALEVKEVLADYQHLVKELAGGDPVTVDVQRIAMDLLTLTYTVYDESDICRDRMCQAEVVATDDDDHGDFPGG